MAHVITNKGTVKVTSDSGETYVLRGDFNSLCEAEERIGKPITGLDFDALGMRDIRSLVQALGSFETPDAAGDAISDVGIEAMSGAMGDALALAVGQDPREEQPESSDANAPGEA